jgi:hypothetical protein
MDSLHALDDDEIMPAKVTEDDIPHFPDTLHIIVRKKFPQLLWWWPSSVFLLPGRGVNRGNRFPLSSSLGTLLGWTG